MSYLLSAAFTAFKASGLDRLLPPLIDSDREATFRLWTEDLLEYRRLYFPHDLSGKTVLDVGAGCGETARRAFLMGARKVIAIEKDARCWPHLIANKTRNQWEMDIIKAPFELAHLELPFDLCKMDIEGAENQLLQLDSLPFAFIGEVHGRELVRKFMGKFGLKILSHSLRYESAIMTNRD